MDQDENREMEKSAPHPFYMKKDLWIMAAILAAALLAAFLLNRFQKGGLALIKVDGRLVKTVSLDRDQTITLDQAPGVVIEVKNGAIGFIKSDCPDQICVQTGFISRQGQVAVCLPNKTVIEIPKGSSGPDAVTKHPLPGWLQKGSL